MGNAKVKKDDNITGNDTVEKTEKNKNKAVNNSDAKKTSSTSRSRSSSALSTQEKIEKIRATEQAKLDALKEREQEKTRLAIEKERERLEQELQNEIRQLEAQLQLTRSTLTDEPLEEIKEVKPSQKTRISETKSESEKTAQAKVAKEKAAKEKADQEKAAQAKAAKAKAAKKKADQEKAAQAKAAKKKTDQEKAAQAVEITETKKKADKKAREKIKETAKAVEEEKVVKKVKPEKEDAKKYEDIADTPVSNLNKLREQIKAQKKLEKELMEKEAQKAQEKDQVIGERIAQLGVLNVENEEFTISMEELEAQRQLIKKLKDEKEESKAKINNLYNILDKITNLQIDGLNILDKKDYSLSSEFLDNHESQKQKLAEMKQKIIKLDEICSENSRQIDTAERAYLRLQETHQAQANRIAELSEQIISLNDHRSVFNQANNSYGIRDYGYRSSDLSSLYRELDGMQRELNRLSASVYNQRLDNLKIKEQEIENLRAEMKKKTEQTQIQYCPYQANPNQPPVIKRTEIESEPVKDNEVFKTEINNIKEEIEKLKDHQLQNHHDSIEIMKEVRDELTRNRDDRNMIINQKDQDIKTIKDELEKSQKEKATLLSEKEVNLRKIEYLENEIKNREETISKMQERLDKLSEDDIIDPDFKRRIRVARDMEKDILSRLEEEENLLKNNLENFSKKMKDKKKIIDDLRANIERLDRNYQNNPNKNSSAKDLYERKKGKSLIELQLQRESLSDLEDDYKRAEKKYQDFEQMKKGELSKVKAKEAEIVEFYLNRLRKEIGESEGFRPLRDAIQERDVLQEQLQDLKSKPVSDNEAHEFDSLDDKEIGLELQTERKAQTTSNIDKLEEQIRSETMVYNQHYQKMTDLKSELEKRIEYEKQLRSQEDDVANFYSHKMSLAENFKQLETLNEQIQEKQRGLAKLKEDPLLRTEYLRQKAEINDLEVHKNDIEVKIGFYKKTIKDLHDKSIIDTYMTLINQINKIRDAYKSIREKADNVKQSIQLKTRQLEEMKGKLSIL